MGYETISIALGSVIVGGLFVYVPMQMKLRSLRRLANKKLQTLDKKHRDLAEGLRSNNSILRQSHEQAIRENTRLKTLHGVLRTESHAHGVPVITHPIDFVDSIQAAHGFRDTMPVISGFMETKVME